MAESENTATEEPQSRRKSKDNDISRLSRSGNSLYELLEIPKTSTESDIKKKYRRLALKYHPDKNPDNAEAEEMFKKINKAHTVLSDEKKRKIYDDYGSFGLYLADQVGDDMVKHLMFLRSPLFKSLFCLCGLITGCYFCCCLCCCCCGCCGKCKVKLDDEEEEVPDVDDLEGEVNQGSDPVTSQPTGNGSAMPMPPPSTGSAPQEPIVSSSDNTEKSPLKPPISSAPPPSYDSVFPNGNSQSS